jgi:acetyl esterase/lipase
MKRRTLLLTALAASLPLRAQTRPPQDEAALPPGLPQPTETIDLWPGGAPGMPESPPQELVVERSTDAALTDRAVRGITVPRLVVFRPAIANGAAVMVVPGGGYRHIVIDKEGYEMGRWLAARGFTVFVLFYRLPAEGWQAGPNVALSDAQRAIRVIRSRSGEFGVDAERVAVMGFSAGGHLTADLATRFATPTYDPVDAADSLSPRPMVVAPIYPVVSMSLPVAHAGSRSLLLGEDASPELEQAHSPQHNVPADAPPCFLVHAEDDMSVVVENSLLLRDALKAKGVPVETHLFAQGGHGFGLRKAIGKPIAAWPELFVGWARTTGLV